jgi:hypothetical protein
LIYKTGAENEQEESREESREEGREEEITKLLYFYRLNPLTNFFTFVLF